MTVPDRLVRKVVRVQITGKVQGVWYRGWTVREAVHHGLDGWVRNRRDGSVEAVFAGAADDVDALIHACHLGPPAARVTAVTVTAEPDPGPVGFAQKPTL